MRLRKSIVVLWLLVTISVTYPPITVQSQTKYAIHGYLSLSLPSQMQTQAPLNLLTIKLYPPKEKGTPVLITYPDSANNFRFSDLLADAYLLEISLGDQPLYQRLLKLESDVLLAIPLGSLTPVSSFTLAERTSQTLSDFQGAVAVRVGDIDHDLKPDRGTLSLTILARAEKTRTVKLTPPKLVMNFNYKGQTYILAGAVRKTPTKEFIDCEIYR